MAAGYAHNQADALEDELGHDNVRVGQPYGIWMVFSVGARP